MVCRLGNVKIDVVVVADTGAAKSVFPSSALPHGTKMSPSSTRLRAANGEELCNLGAVAMTTSLGDGPKATIEAVVSSELHGPPLISFRDLTSMGVELRFPDRTPIMSDSMETGVITSINMLAADQQFLGEGEDSLDDIKADFPDVLCSSLGEAAGCMKGPKMTIQLDETKPFKPIQVMTARQVPAHGRTGRKRSS